MGCYCNVFIRVAILVITCLSLIFFHILFGLYFRFFNTYLPFDILHQWKDVFVVGKTGIGFLSVTEMLLCFFIPSVFAFLVFISRSKPNYISFLICLLILVPCWEHRISRDIYREPAEMEALPDFIHRFVHWNFNGLDEKEYEAIVKDIESRIPRNLTDYQPVKEKGILLEPRQKDVSSPKRECNIVLIMMESFRAAECGSVNPHSSLTESLDKLAENARIYKNFYANASQTARAELALLASVYPNPIGVPTYLINPTIDLIALPEILSKNGYETLWISGYTADFHNKRFFLNSHGINKIYDRDTLPPPEQDIIGWGMNDNEMLGHAWDIINDTPEPFFAEITTLSSHISDDTEYPNNVKLADIEGGDMYRNYMKGTAYTADAVAKFIDKLLSSKFAQNTIVIVTGDHGLWLFKEDKSSIFKKTETFFRSPLLIWAPPKVLSSGVDETIGSHIDIAPTILDMLNIRAQNTFMGTSLLRNDVDAHNRYAVSFFGNTPILRTDKRMLLPNSLLSNASVAGRYAKVENSVQRFNIGNPHDTKAYRVKGDLLNGNFNTKLINNQETDKFKQVMTDIYKVTAYSIYKNAYMGE